MSGLWNELMKSMHSCKGFEFHVSSCGFSLVHQADDLALKSPKIIVNKALLVAVSFKIVLKFNRKFWNSLASWLEDLYTTPI